MSILSEQEAKAILDKVVKLSKADECSAQLTGSITGNIRYALNSVSTSGTVDDLQLGVQVAFGKRVGTATINEFDDASLEKVVRRAEELASLAPENPEFMPAIGKQTYKPQRNLQRQCRHYAGIPRRCRRGLHRTVQECRQTGRRRLPDRHAGLFCLMANSNGNFAYQKSTGLDSPAPCAPTTVAVRAGSRATCATSMPFDAKKEIAIAIDKAKRSADAKALEPGKYTVILEPAASLGPDLLHDVRLSTHARPTKAAASCPRRAAATRSARSCSTSVSRSMPIPGMPMTPRSRRSMRRTTACRASA